MALDRVCMKCGREGAEKTMQVLYAKVMAGEAIYLATDVYICLGVVGCGIRVTEKAKRRVREHRWSMSDTMDEDGGLKAEATRMIKRLRESRTEKPNTEFKYKP